MIARSRTRPAPSALAARSRARRRPPPFILPSHCRRGRRGLGASWNRMRRGGRAILLSTKYIAPPSLTLLARGWRRQCCGALEKRALISRWRNSGRWPTTSRPRLRPPSRAPPAAAKSRPSWGRVIFWRAALPIGGPPQYFVHAPARVRARYSLAGSHRVRMFISNNHPHLIAGPI